MNYLKLFVAFALCILPTISVEGSRTATDLMSQALQQRSAGNMSQAVEQLKRAVNAARNPMQKNLALSMLGDSQIQLNDFEGAVKTFKELKKNVTSAEDRAEALFRLIEAEAGRGNFSQAAKLVEQMQQKHANSAYLNLAQSFARARNITLSGDRPSDRAAIPTTKPKATRTQKPQRQKPVSIDPAPDHSRTPSGSQHQPAARPQQKILQPAAIKPTPIKPTPSKSSVNADLVKTALNIDVLDGNAQEELITDILLLQNKLKQSRRHDADSLLLQLAEKTLLFGEVVEACQLYDRILSEHPRSKHIETAYYNSIRLRAALDLHSVVVEWADAFLNAFPRSRYREKVVALKHYSELDGKMDLSGAQISRSLQILSPSVQNARIADDNVFQQAQNFIRNDEFEFAAENLRSLASVYPDSTKLWWETTLVYIQLEKFEKAEAAIRRLIRIDPGNEDASSMLGYILYRLEQYEQAANVYDKLKDTQDEGISYFDGRSAAERLKMQKRNEL